MPNDDGYPPGAIQQPVLLGPTVISSTVLGLVAWWLGSHTNLVEVRDLVVRNFKPDDIFVAWCKLREACQQAASQPVQAPPKHRAETKLAEELVKEVSESEKSGIITMFVPAIELGLVRGRLECNVGDERPVASRLESLEDMVKGVVEKLARMETNQARQVKATQPVIQPTVAASLTGQVGQQQNYAAVAAAGLSFAPNQVQQLLVRQRRNSQSMKRSVSGAVRDTDGNTVTGNEDVFSIYSGEQEEEEERGVNRNSNTAVNTRSRYAFTGLTPALCGQHPWQHGEGDLGACSQGVGSDSHGGKGD